MSTYSDYKQMMKPRITMLVLVTSYLGFYLGLRSMGQYFFTIEQVLLFVHLMVGTFLTASGAAVLNQVMEKDLLLDFLISTSIDFYIKFT